MDGFVWMLLLLFGGYVAVKYYSVKVEVVRRTQNKWIAPPGVNYYCNAPVTHRPQQVQAYEATNNCATLPAGTAPAFGPQENQPVPIASLEI